MTGETLLEAEDLAKVFSRKGQPDIIAVRGVSFSLSRGERLGLIGESGSGKSTVARLLTRLLAPTRGRVRFDGTDIGEARGEALRAYYREVQMVFQSPRESFDPRRTLGDGIGESLRNAGMPAAEVRGEVGRLLSASGLSPDFAARYPHEASGGQCQRAAIARALAIKPKLLICDEATSALDVTVQSEIIALLDTLTRERGMACLFISHDIALVQDFCDRALVMKDGEIVEAGTPDALVRAPRHPYTKSLIESVL